MYFKTLFIFFVLTMTGIFSGFLRAADFECISNVCRVEVIKNKLYTIDTVVCQVNNRNGERFSNFSISYSKILKVTHLNAWIEDSNGSKIRDLKKTEYRDEPISSDGSLYQDDRAISFQIKHNKYPYRVCYTASYTESQYIGIVDWKPLDNDHYPTREARLYVSFPREYAVNSYVKNVPSIHSDTLPDKIQTEYLVKGNPLISKVPDKDLFVFDNPRVALVPLNFKLGIDGNSESWTSYGSWFLNLNKGLTLLPEEEKLKVNRILQGVTDTVSIVKILYQYLQDNTRYVNVSVGIGGWKSYPASYVAQNKYGDCKALTNYMKALLANKGIKSYFVLINAGNHSEKFIDELPGSQFNHVILAVPLKRDTLWLDNTDKFSSFGYVGTFIQNRKALLIEQDHSHLVSIPSLKKEDVTSIRKMNMSLDTVGNANLSAVFTNKGSSYEYMNSFRNYLNENDMNQYISGLIPFTHYEIKGWKFEETNRDAPHINLHLNLVINKLAKVMDNDYYIPTFPMPMGLEFPEPANLPVSIYWPVCNVDSLMFSIPAEYKIGNLPKPILYTTDFGTFTFITSVLDTKICVYKKLEIYPGKYSAADYEKLFAFQKSIKELESGNLIYLTRKVE